MSKWDPKERRRCMHAPNYSTLSCNALTDATPEG